MFKFLSVIALLLFCNLAYAQDAYDLQNRMVRAARDIRIVEQTLLRVETRLGTLNEKKAELDAEYQTRRAKMAATLAALTRMGRTPREAVLIRPGGPLQAARTTMLLSASLPVVETQAASFRDLLTELERTRADLAKKTTQAQIARRDLRARHEKLSSLMDARANNGGRASKGEAAQIAALARDAKTLRDLLGALDGGDASAPAQENLGAVSDGEGQLPVSGLIRVRYGQRDDMGTKSSGLSIETLPGSIVVAPLGGIVRYAGPFKGYGNIVIIAHKGGYHSLIAKLDKINVSVGQVIVSGEPIAILSDTMVPNRSTTAARKTVYYELRRGGSPVDPARKLPDLG